MAVMIFAGINAQAQTVYSQRNKHYRPQPGTVIGNAGPGAHGPRYTRFSAIVEGGLACVAGSDEYKHVSGTMSMSAGALVNESIFAGAMIKYSGVGAYEAEASKASNCIIGADVRYFFPGYLIYPFIGGQIGGDIRKQTVTGPSVSPMALSKEGKYFYGGVKVGAKYQLSPFLATIFAVGVDNAGGITTIPFTVGFQF